MTSHPLTSEGGGTLRDRLQHVTPDVWDDIESALQQAIDNNYGPDLDVLDCTLLLDLVRVHRGIGEAKPLREFAQLVLSGLRRGSIKAQGIAVGNEDDAQMRVVSLAQLAEEALGGAA